MSDTTRLDYAALINATPVVNVFTEEVGQITAAANGCVEITLTEGPDKGVELTMTPGEAISCWRKVN